MSLTAPDGVRKRTDQTRTVDIHQGAPEFNSEEEANAAVALAMQMAAQRDMMTALSQWAQNEFLRCKNARQPFERQWYLNIAFYLGRQYVAPIIASGQFKLTVPPAPKHRVRMVVNKVRPAIRKEVSKLASSRPVATVVPATSEDEDYAAANVAEAILKSLFQDSKTLKTNNRWIWWGAMTGTGFIKQYWDVSCPDYDSMTVPDPKDVQIPMGDSGQMAPPELVAELFKLNPPKPQPARGKIQRELVTPFHFYVPDLLNDLENQPYAIHVMAKSPLWVKKKYGIDAVPDALAEQSIMDSVNLITKGHSNDQYNAVLVKEFWIKPNGHPMFPKGGMITVIGNQVIQPVFEWPLPYPEYPFYPYSGIDTGGFYGDSVIVDLIPVQKEYNKKRSQSIEITNGMGKPKLVYQAGSIDPRKLSSEANQSIPYTAGYDKPEIMPGVEVPTSMLNEIENLKGEFDDISGQHEVSRGTTPSSVTSGTAIAFLGEQDDSQLHTQVEGIEQAMQASGTHYLKLAGQYWDDGRIVNIAGDNLAFESISWKKNLLRGNTDVKVQAGSGLPYSKAARNAQVQEWITTGMIPPELGMEMLSVTGFEKHLEDILVDKRQAQRENLKMADTSATSIYELMVKPAPGPNGVPPLPPFNNPETGQDIQLNADGTPFMPTPAIPVNSWDDHEQHIMWHNNYRKSQQFEVLPEANKMQFELHVQMHQMAIMSQMVNTGGAMVQDNTIDPDNPQPTEEPTPVGPEETTTETEETSNEPASSTGNS